MMFFFTLLFSLYTNTLAMDMFKILSKIPDAPLEPYDKVSI